jgi:hypothetical protein
MHTTGVIVIACYRPRPDCDAALLEVVQDHVPTLRRLGLATDRRHVMMRASDGTILEVFEWCSTDAINQAHNHPEVQQMWNRFNDVCFYEPPANLEECKQLFPGFTPLN